MQQGNRFIDSVCIHQAQKTEWEREQRSQTEPGEQSEWESTFIRADSVGFQAALQEIRLECVVIPLGSLLYPDSFTTLPCLSSSMCAPQSMILIKHHPGLGLYLLTGKGNRDAVKLHPSPPGVADKLRGRGKCTRGHALHNPRSKW